MVFSVVHNNNDDIDNYGNGPMIRSCVSTEQSDIMTCFHSALERAVQCASDIHYFEPRCDQTYDSYVILPYVDLVI